MLKKIVALAAVVLLSTTGVAAAQDYPTEGNGIVADDTVVQPGESITLSARTFVGQVTFTMFSAPVNLGTATADANGVATLTTTVPAGTTPGTHRVEATGTGTNGQPLTVVLSITVAGTAGDAGNLPTTGSSNSIPMGQMAIAAIAAGGLLVLLANKRRTAAQAETRETAGV